jgi:rSAM/selenodomain-associated transferase 2
MGLAQSRQEDQHGRCSLSVVIPTLNEEMRIGKCIDAFKPLMGPRMEVVVVDGGSSDGTSSRARAMGAKVISSSRGRGKQMNIGWRAAQKDIDWLVFLHADSIVSQKGLLSLMDAIKHEKIRCWGCFKSIEVKFDQERSPPRPTACLASNLIRSGVELRTRLFHTPYGDQGIFIKRETMDNLEGFKEWRLLEDVEIVSRLRKISAPIILDSNLTTSGRRWEKLGLMRTFAVNQLILLGYRLGADVNMLADLYHSQS